MKQDMNYLKHPQSPNHELDYSFFIPLSKERRKLYIAHLNKKCPDFFESVVKSVHYPKYRVLFYRYVNKFTEEAEEELYYEDFLQNDFVNCYNSYLYLTREAGFKFNLITVVNKRIVTVNDYLNTLPDSYPERISIMFACELVTAHNTVLIAHKLIKQRAEITPSCQPIQKTLKYFHGEMKKMNFELLKDRVMNHPVFYGMSPVDILQRCNYLKLKKDKYYIGACPRSFTHQLLKCLIIIKPINKIGLSLSRLATYQRSIHIKHILR